MVVRDAEVEERGCGALDVDAALVESLGKPRGVSESLRKDRGGRTFAAATSPSSRCCVPFSRHCMASTSAGSTVVDCAVVEVAHPVDIFQHSATVTAVLRGNGQQETRRAHTPQASAKQSSSAPLAPCLADAAIASTPFLRLPLPIIVLTKEMNRTHVSVSTVVAYGFRAHWQEPRWRQVCV